MIVHSARHRVGGPDPLPTVVEGGGAARRDVDATDHHAMGSVGDPRRMEGILAQVTA